MKTPSDRLKEARLRAGFETPTAFAKAHDIPEPTYRGYENGNRALTQRAARQFAPLLSVSVAWLLFGEQAEVTEEEKEMVFEFRGLTGDQKAIVRALTAELRRARPDPSSEE